MPIYIYESIPQTPGGPRPVKWCTSKTVGSSSLA